MNILFTLCGRAGSKGVRSKNILDFLETPLPFYSLGAIKLFAEAHSGEYSNIDTALSTDSAELKRLIKNADPDAFIIDRAAELSGDAIRKIDVIRDAAKRAEKKFNREYDLIIDLDITSPLRTLKDIENVADKRKTLGDDFDVVYTVTEARRNPYFNMVEKKGRYYDRVLNSDFASRQQAPPIYDMNASIYAYVRPFIYGDNPFFNRADIVVMRDTGILDIDSADDFELMEVIAKYLFEKYEEYKDIKEAADKLSEKTRVSI